jgi:phosphoenolpyruvate carboxykinase (GTP)
MWPGYGENMRVLKWMFGRINNKENGTETALGYMPDYEDIDWNGLNFSKEQFQNVMSIDSEKWMREVLLHKEFFLTLQSSLPREFIDIQENNFVSLAKLNAKAPIENVNSFNS